MHTILHISDLHRSATEPVTNDSLIASLLADRDRFVFETPQVPNPDSMVVSGDIVQGAALDADDWVTEIHNQYKVAHDFLARLTDRILDGDRSRVVLLPGNHDVCWNTARSAMRSVPRSEEPSGIPEVLFRPGSKYRWSWKTREVFEVNEPDAYARRLDAYWTFVENFYSGVNLTFPLQRGRGFNLFELAAGQIILAAFESVHGNDCFSFQGALDSDTVAKCSLAIRDAAKPYVLRMAAWHHAINGPRGGTDYMDGHNVHEMIGNGFRLGLHGHQHHAEAAAHYIHLPEQQAMAVLSTGSLCAGSRDLPRGTDRQYNIVAIDQDFLSARVHVREMSDGYQFGRCTRGPFSVDGSICLSWQRPADEFGRDPVARRQAELILSAEASMHTGDIATAKQVLAGVSTPTGSYARSLLVEAALRTRDWDSVVRILAEPSSADELVNLVQAQIELGRTTAAAASLAQNAGRFALAERIRRDLEDRIELSGLLGKQGT